jgi:hypothetical protein
VEQGKEGRLKAEVSRTAKIAPNPLQKLDWIGLNWSELDWIGLEKIKKKGFGTS